MTELILKNPKNLTITWFGYWIIAVGLVVWLFKLSGFSYDRHYYLFTPFFILMSCLAVNLFKAKKLLLNQIIPSKIFVLLIIPTLLFLGATLATQEFLPLSQDKIDFYKNLGLGFPYFTPSTFIVKTFDIFYQQTMILILILSFKKFEMNNNQIIRNFSLIFFILHLPLILFFGVYGFIFIVPCVVAGGLFSFLILNYEYGHYYSAMVHQAFYLILGLILRLV